MITGSQDMLTPFGDAEELAEMIPARGCSELRGAAHGLMVEQPSAFNGAVLEFLRDVDTRLAVADDRRHGAARAPPSCASGHWR